MTRMILAISVLGLGVWGLMSTRSLRETYARMSPRKRRLGGYGHVVSAFGLGTVFLSRGTWGWAEVLAFAGFCCWFSIGVLIASIPDVRQQPTVRARGLVPGLLVAVPGGLLVVLAVGRFEGAATLWFAGLGSLLVVTGCILAFMRNTRELAVTEGSEDQ